MNRICLAAASLSLALSSVVAADPTHGYFVASGGVKIHYMVEGRGTPVVLIHGYTGSAQGNWFSNGVAAALVKNHRVIAIDVRGHGLSDKPREASSYGEHLWRDVLELMDHLDVEKAHVHGYSMGGAITTQLLIHAPERFITAAYGGSGVREVDPERLAEVPADRQGSDPREAQASGTLRASPTRDGEALALVRSTWIEAFSGQIDLTRIRVPVLAINGSLDQQVPAVENLAAIRAALANNTDATVLELEGLNHLFQTAETGALGEYYDIPETFAPSALELVANWINARF